MPGKYAISPNEARLMDTETLRHHFLFDNLLQQGACNMVYTHYDRMVIGGALPTTQAVELLLIDDLKAGYFLERREIGIINVGGPGVVTANDHQYNMEKLDCLYLGKGTKNVTFKSSNNIQPAVYFLLSCPAHQIMPNTLMTREQATPAHMGDSETSNKRTIYKYIHDDGIASCQLVMGLTLLQPGSVWNTMPAHTHDRRMEAYFYFDVQPGQGVFHLMGLPNQTRHLVINNNQAVVSPPWSIHAGCGTSNYSFIWGMAGENKAFTDMDAVAIADLQ